MILRKLVGGLVLAGGVGLVGAYGTMRTSFEMENDIRAWALSATETAIHGVQTRVEGRDITISGIADTEAEREAILASLDVVDGRRVVHDEIEVLPAAAPYVFELTSNADGIAASGNAPTAIAQAAIDEGTGMDLSGDLPLASGAPEGIPWLSSRHRNRPLH